MFNLRRLLQPTLRQKLVLGFGLNILLIAAMVVSSIRITGGMTGSLQTIRDEAFPQALASLDIENSINLIVLGIEASTESGTQTFIDDAEKVQKDLTARLGELKTLMEGSARTVQSLEELSVEVQQLFKSGEDLFLATVYMEYDRLPDLVGKFGRQKEDLLSEVASLKKDGVSKLDASLRDISVRSSNTGRFAMILGVTAILVSLGVIVILSLSIMGPINRLIGLMKQAEDGDLTVRYENDHLTRCWEERGCGEEDCPAHGSDDLRCWQVAGSHSAHGLGEAGSDGRDCERCPVYRKASGDEFTAIGEAFNNMVAGVVNLLHLVRSAAIEVRNASKILIDFSEDLRVGSDQQARSVDEVTASIEEMDSSIRSVAGNVENYYSTAEESNTSILEMTASIEEVANSAEQLTAIVEKTGSHLDELTASIRQVAQHSGALSSQVEQSSAALLEIDSSIKEVAEGTRDSSELAALVTDRLMKEGSTAVKRTSDAIVEVRSIVTDASDVIRNLGERSSDIGNILKVIDEVSDQTRLLALNAAILAAQSGSQGRAFSVVAEEIRALSERTSASTLEITQLLGSIPVQVEEVTRAIEKGTEKVDEGVTLIGEVQGAIKVVAEAARKSAEASSMIMNATSEQAGGIRQASELEQGIALMSREIAEATRYQAESCEQIMASASQMKDLAGQVKRATEEQAVGTKLIGQSSSESMKLAKSISEATREEAAGSRLIVESIEKVSAATTSNMEVFARLGEVVESLAQHSRLLYEEMERFRTEGEI